MEEARRRARRRRYGYAAVIVAGLLLAGGGLYAGLGGGGDGGTGVPTTGRASAPSGPVPAPTALSPGTGAFDRCRLDPQRGGGHDVWIKDISCAHAQEWIPRLLPTFNVTDREGIGALEGGWQCWSREEGRGSSIHNVCVRGPQLIIFDFS